MKLPNNRQYREWKKEPLSKRLHADQQLLFKQVHTN
jgi:hypothetical protein